MVCIQPSVDYSRMLLLSLSLLSFELKEIIPGGGGGVRGS